MGKKSIILVLSFFSLSVMFLTPFSIEASNSSQARVIKVEITSDGRFVPDKISIRQDENVVFRVTALKGDEVTWPPDVLHGFYLMYDNITLINKTIRIENKDVNRATIEVQWVSRFAGEFTLRCPYHQHKFAIVTVKQ